MRILRTLVALSLVSTVVFLATGQASRQPQEIYWRVNQEVAEGVTARGFIAVSAPLQTVDAPQKRVRVVSRSILIVRNDQILFEFVGQKTIDADSAYEIRQGVHSGGVEGVASSPDAPRRCTMTLKPRGDQRWDTVTSSDQLDLQIQWEEHR